MARYSSGMTAAGAGTSLQPIFAILSTASAAPTLREVGIFNNTAVSVSFKIITFTGGTAGAATLTARKHRTSLPAAVCLPKSLYTANVTLVEDTGYRCMLGAAVGSGMVFTFGDAGLSGDIGATAGIGIAPIGTGQVCEIYFVWDE